MSDHRKQIGHRNTGHRSFVPPTIAAVMADRLTTEDTAQVALPLPPLEPWLADVIRKHGIRPENVARTVEAVALLRIKGNRLKYVSDQTLLSPQWLQIVAEALGWPDKVRAA